VVPFPKPSFVCLHHCPQVIRIARENGFELVEIKDMPAGNFMLTFSVDRK
jgi:hypothetical protein